MGGQRVGGVSGGLKHEPKKLGIFWWPSFELECWHVIIHAGLPGPERHI